MVRKQAIAAPIGGDGRSRNASNEHGGGGLFAYDETIMGWLFYQTGKQA